MMLPKTVDSRLIQVVQCLFNYFVEDNQRHCGISRPEDAVFV